MSIRTTVTLDEDIATKLKEQSLRRGVPFRKLLNEVLRKGLDAFGTVPARKRFKVDAVDMGYMPGVSYDNISGLIEVGEGDAWR